MATVSPPVPRRDEDRVIYAGVAPEGWDTKMPRQSNDSIEKLLDPAVPMSDPYGWLRDDKREKKDILEHLKVSFFLSLGTYGAFFFVHISHTFLCI